LQLRIDPEFQSKIPSLTDAEYQQLEENILEAGEVYEPIVTWNGVIVDGHNRYKIVQAHPEIQYRTREMEFPDKWAAFDWMYKNQLGRRNLTDENRTYCIGKMYEARKNTEAFRGNQHTLNTGGDQNDPKQTTATIIAKELGIGQATVKRAEKFAKGVDAIREQFPETADAILNGKTKVKKVDVMAVAKADEQDKAEMIQAIQRVERIPNRIKTTPKADAKNEIDNLISELYAEDTKEYTIIDLVAEMEDNCERFLKTFRAIIFDHKSLCDNNLMTVNDTVKESLLNKIYEIMEEMKSGNRA